MRAMQRWFCRSSCWWPFVVDRWWWCCFLLASRSTATTAWPDLDHAYGGSSSSSAWSGPVVRLEPSVSGVGAALTVNGNPTPPLWIGGCTGINCAGSGTWASRNADWNFSVAQAARAGLALVEVELPPYQWHVLPPTETVIGALKRTLAANPKAVLVLRLYFDSKPQTGFENMTVSFSNGTIAQPTCEEGGCPPRAALSPAWVARTATQLQTSIVCWILGRVPLNLMGCVKIKRVQLVNNVIDSGWAH